MTSTAALRDLLKHLNPVYYTAERLHTLSDNDMVYAIRQLGGHEDGTVVARRSSDPHAANLTEQLFPILMEGTSGAAQQFNRAALNAAIAIANSSPVGGVIHVPKGVWAVDISPGPLTTITSTMVHVHGVGALSSKLLPFGGGGAASALWRIQTNPFSTNQAGSMKRLSIDMANAGLGAFGIWYGDVTGFTFEDVIVTGGFQKGGWWEDNRTQFTERTVINRCWANQCDPNLRLSVNGGLSSHSYSKFQDFRMNLYGENGTGQLGIDIETGVFAYHVDWDVLGNVAGGAGINPSTWFRIRGNAQLLNSNLDFKGEQTTGTGATGIDVGAGTVLNYRGTIDLPFTTPIVKAGTLSVFGGVYNLITPGGVIVIDVSKMDQSDGLAQIILQGNVGASSFSPGIRGGKLYTIAVIQDGTGGRTMVWPPNVFWANNSPPVLTATANWRDVFQFYSDGANLFEVSRALNNP